MSDDGPLRGGHDARRASELENVVADKDAEIGRLKSDVAAIKKDRDEWREVASIGKTELARAKEEASAPVPMILTCPLCGARHVDKGEFATKPHHTHACQGCGLTWRPAKVFTVGVQFLPGYKDAP